MPSFAAQRLLLDENCKGLVLETNGTILQQRFRRATMANKCRKSGGFHRLLHLFLYVSVQDFAVLAGVVEVESQELQKAIRSLQDQIEVCARCSEYL